MPPTAGTITSHGPPPGLPPPPQERALPHHLHQDPIFAKMHIEVQVALNFVISYLYNKLPRRRVNIFGEELERALKDKFRGHWYPEKPFRGSAFRCLKTGDPIDPVLERAARESGVPVQDILENLPHELAVWVDPGEVSYRIGEKGAVKILFSDKHDLSDDHLADREVTKTFNPEAQCFRPIEAMQSMQSMQHAANHHGSGHSNGHANGHSNGHHGHMPGLVLPPSQPSSPFEQGGVGAIGAIGQPVPVGAVVAPAPLGGQALSQAMNALGAQLNGQALNGGGNPVASPSSAPSPIPYKGSPSPVTPFLPRSSAPLTFTTATFAQTKFGSTKLKTNSKRANRMSPTEFSNYIKQRAMQQQQQQMHHHPVGHHHLPSQLSPQGGPQGGAGHRSLSPSLLNDPSFFFQSQFQQHQPQHFNARGGMFDSSSHGPSHGHGPSPFLDMYSSNKGYSSFMEHNSYFGGSGFGSGTPTPGPIGSGLSAGSSGAGSAGGSHSPGVIGGGLGGLGGGIGSSSSSSLGGGGAAGGSGQAQAEKQLLDGFNNFSLSPHPSSSQYQHLLVAN